MRPRNWPLLARAFTFREKIVVFVLLSAMISAVAFWIGAIYLNATKPVPAFGGQYIEGVIGQPAYINPLLSQSALADADIVQLVYAGLFSRDADGEIVLNLAESYEISDENKKYTVVIRQDALWHDGASVTADDVVFTIKTVQDQAYGSPLRYSWQGVEVEKKDDHTVEFVLKKAHAGFVENLTLGILPKHVWVDVTSDRFSLAETNIRPVGSGPYRFGDMQKDSNGTILSYSLEAFQDFYKPAFIQTITFHFFPDATALIDAYRNGDIMGMRSIAPQQIELVEDVKKTQLHEVTLPLYLAVIFNQTKNKALAYDEVRTALSMATDRQEVINRVLNGKGKILTSPFTYDSVQYSEEGQQPSFNIDEAKKVLDKNGWEVQEDGVRKKGDIRLEFTILLRDWAEMNQMADVLKEQWSKVGADVSIETMDAGDLRRNHIQPREYDALISVENIGITPDLFQYWHSSQKDDPGLNLAIFKNDEADEILKEITSITETDKRIEKYAELQKILAEEVPAIFVTSPSYLYLTSTDVKGIELSRIASVDERFSQVENWYIKTKRVKKESE